MVINPTLSAADLERARIYVDLWVSVRDDLLPVVNYSPRVAIQIRVILIYYRGLFRYAFIERTPESLRRLRAVQAMIDRNELVLLELLNNPPARAV